MHNPILKVKSRQGSFMKHLAPTIQNSPRGVAFNCVCSLLICGCISVALVVEDVLVRASPWGRVGVKKGNGVAWLRFGSWNV